VALKPDGKEWAIKEQIVEDLVTGLTFQFALNESDEEAPFRLKITGDLPFGNREILFSADGEKMAAGTLLVEACRPSWLKEVS